MRLTVAPEVFTAFPGMRIVAVLARGIDNRAEHPGVRENWEHTWDNTAEARSYGNSQSHPRVRPWRAAFQRIGVSGKHFPSSIEALLRRALKGGPPVCINALVDSYNTVSLAHTVPAGGFDLADLGDRLDLRFTREGDTFQALDEDSAAPVPPGEVAYAAGSIVLTRHFVWRQARAGMITHDTRDVLLVSEILGDLGDDVDDAVESDLLKRLSTAFGVEGQSRRLDRTCVDASWQDEGHAA